VGKIMFGMRYIVQIDQKLMNRKKRKAKGKNLKMDIEYMTGIVMTVKESETVDPTAS
jgi:hypothetical protein